MAFEPTIKWGDATLNEEFQSVVVLSLHLSDEATPMEASIRALETYELDEEAWEQLMDDEQEPQIAFLCKTTTASELAQQEAAKKRERTFEEMIPEEYRCHRKIFDEEASHCFPPSRPWCNVYHGRLPDLGFVGCGDPIRFEPEVVGRCIWVLSWVWNETSVQCNVSVYVFELQYPYKRVFDRYNGCPRGVVENVDVAVGSSYTFIIVEVKLVTDSADRDVCIVQTYGASST
ncbi:hypothetical protein EDB86DRAFT_3075249 [Lactarius hatsudake]|nr:hypothetical protein EDB86DRAFT_3075249 [Lactarius hatsudake]